MTGALPVTLAITVGLALIVVGSYALKYLPISAAWRAGLGVVLVIVASFLMVPLIGSESAIAEQPWHFGSTVGLWGLGINQIAQVLRDRGNKSQK